MRFSIFLTASLTLCIGLVGYVWSRQQIPTSPPVSIQASPSPSSKPIADVPVPPLGVAQKVCGDALPTDEKAYPVIFYPVLVSYSEKNLELVKKHFCKDAIRISNIGLPKYVIQVGSFTNREKAENFQSKLDPYLRKVEGGEPIIIIANPSKLSDRQVGNKNLDTVERIAAAALLNSEQVENLISLEKSRIFYREGSKGIEIGKFKVLVPTYVPPNFTLAEASWISLAPRDENDIKYRLIYKSLNGESFNVQQCEPLGDGPSFLEDSGRIEHSVLGKIRLWYSSYEKSSKYNQITLQGPSPLTFQGKKSGYCFSSGSNSMTRVEKSISMKEAIKIVNSLKALNPKTQFDITPDKGWCCMGWKSDQKRIQQKNEDILQSLKY